MDVPNPTHVPVTDPRCSLAALPTAVRTAVTGALEVLKASYR